MLRGIFDCGGVRKQNGHWQSSNVVAIPITGGNIGLLGKSVSEYGSHYEYIRSLNGISQRLEPGHKYHVEFKLRVDPVPDNLGKLEALLHRLSYPVFIGDYRFIDANGVNVGSSSTFHVPYIFSNADINVYSTYSSSYQPLVAKITNIYLDSRFSFLDSSQWYEPNYAACVNEDATNSLVGSYVVASYDIEYIEEYHSRISIDTGGYSLIRIRYDYDGLVDFDIPEIGQLDMIVTEIV